VRVVGAQRLERGDVDGVLEMLERVDYHQESCSTHDVAVVGAYYLSTS
jgi:hypothetical protein